MATRCHEFLSGNGKLRFLTATEFFVFSAIIEADGLSSISTNVRLNISRVLDRFLIWICEPLGSGLHK